MRVMAWMKMGRSVGILSSAIADRTAASSTIVQPWCFRLAAMARVITSPLPGSAFTMETGITVTVIIVSWNTRDYSRECLKSLLEASQNSASLCVRVVDNGSRDGTPETVRAEFPGVKLDEPGENLGFARANNRALAACRTDYA